MAAANPSTVRLPGGATCVIRGAVPEDAAALLAFEVLSNATNPFNVREPDEVGRDLGEVREWLARYRDGPGQIALVALDPRGGIIGELSFKAGERRKLAHHGHFGISVHPDWRGRGVGTALIVTLLDWAAAHPVVEKVCLGVFENNTRARALYRRLGFVEEGRQRRFFKLGPGVYADDIQMSIYVKPGVAPEGFGSWVPGACGRGSPR